MLVTPQASRLDNLANGAIRVVSVWLRAMDFCRTRILRRSLKIGVLRILYIQLPLRLFATFLVLSLCYLPLALLRPDILLVFAPLMLGYPHLIASYRFVQFDKLPAIESAKLKTIQAYLLMTIAALVLKFIFKQLDLLPEFPYGALEIAIVASVFSLLKLRAKTFEGKAILLCWVLNIILLKVAWSEPLIFVAAILILHNWVAFAFWVLAAKERSEKAAAMLATFIFGVIHYAIFSGKLDAWMPMTIGAALHSANLEATSWALAPWSSDPLIWRRTLTLYTFGLSLHYFVWLKALPESLNRHTLPNSFGKSFKLLRKDLGTKTTCFFLMLGLACMIVWFFSFSFGAAIYFAMASLHGWLELNCLAAKSFASKDLGVRGSMGIYNPEHIVRIKDDIIRT